MTIKAKVVEKKTALAVFFSFEFPAGFDNLPTYKTFYVRFTVVANSFRRKTQWWRILGRKPRRPRSDSQIFKLYPSLAQSGQRCTTKEEQESTNLDPPLAVNVCASPILARQSHPLNLLCFSEHPCSILLNSTHRCNTVFIRKLETGNQSWNQ